MKLNCLIPAVLLCCFSVTSFACPKPKACPSISSIQKFGINPTLFLDDHTNTWEGEHGFDNYDGDYPKWSFHINGIPGKDNSEAYANAIASLKSLVQVSKEPEPGISNQQWVCSYRTSQGYPAILITPLI